MVKSIIVVGGGSAGWITATYLDNVLNGGLKAGLEICVVESPKIGRIGVGEATVPSLRHTLPAMGVREQDFMRAADATFKSAIKFDNWLYEKHSYYHPFDRRRQGHLEWTGRDWSQSDRSLSFAHTVSPLAVMCDERLSPRAYNSTEFGSPVGYAYHMDAQKFADYLADVSVKRGVKRIFGEVASVDVDAEGSIRKITLSDGIDLTADFYVDCTGFRSLLLGQALKVEFEDFGNILLADSAVTMQVPYDVHYSGGINPYTSATAVSNGWIWDIPQASRRGIGYVYSSAYQDDEDAEREFRAFEGAHSADLPVKKISFRPGMRREAWSGNCAAIGLAGGFIEPLESTGIYLIETTVRMLADYFPFNGDMSKNRARFNDLISRRYREILDFVNLHYALTRRTDTEFWRDVQKPEHITSNLAGWLELWRNKAPSPSDIDDQQHCFTFPNWEFVLYGMDYKQTLSPTPSAAQPPEVMKAVEQLVASARHEAPPHAEWVYKHVLDKVPDWHLAHTAS